MALKASESAYRGCNHCTGAAMMMTDPEQQLRKSNDVESELSTLVPERFRWSYLRTGSKDSSSGRMWGKEMQVRLKGISVGNGGGGDVLSVSGNGRKTDPVVLEEEKEPKEWVAVVEPGLLITFVSLPRGGNGLKRIRFNLETFNKGQAQKWWHDNFDKVTELYNVQRLNRQAFPLQKPPRFKDEGCSTSDRRIEDSPIPPPPPPPLSNERLPQTLNHPTGMGYSFDHMVRSNLESSSMGASSSSHEADRSRNLSISYNVSDMKNEWVEQVEPGVDIIIKVLSS